MSEDATLKRISEHVYWMPPGPPDRPSLAAVVGTRQVLLLDAGASAAHARLFVDALRAAGVDLPTLLALSHAHWDHVFGAAELGLPTLAHRRTAGVLATMAGYAWTDEAIDARVAAGTEIQSSADDIKLELPAPRAVRIHQPEVIVDDALELRLGGVTCKMMHVGGDHAYDSCVFHVPQDRVLFLGDCLYPNIHGPEPHFSPWGLLPLLDALSALDAQHLIGGHEAEILDAAAFEDTALQARVAVVLVDAIGPDRTRILDEARARYGIHVNDAMLDYVDGLLAGLRR